MLSHSLLSSGPLKDADEKKIKRVVPRAANKVIDQTVARLYIAYPDPRKWQYTGLYGAIVLVDDLVGKSFFLKLVDIEGNRGVLWDMELYRDFLYNQDRTYFHSFELEECLAGLLFEDKSEAAHFHKRVTQRTKHASKETSNNNAAIPRRGAPNAGGAGAGGAQAPPPPPSAGPRNPMYGAAGGVPGAPGPRGDLSGAHRRKGKQIYYDDEPPVEWRALYKDLAGMGITEDMIAANTQFIKDFINRQGGPLVGQEPPLPRRFATESDARTGHTAPGTGSRPPPPPPPPQSSSQPPYTASVSPPTASPSPAPGFADDGEEAEEHHSSHFGNIGGFFKGLKHHYHAEVDTALPTPAVATPPTPWAALPTPGAAPPSPAAAASPAPVVAPHTPAAAAPPASVAPSAAPPSARATPPQYQYTAAPLAPKGAPLAPRGAPTATTVTPATSIRRNLPPPIDGIGTRVGESLRTKSRQLRAQASPPLSPSAGVPFRQSSGARKRPPPVLSREPIDDVAPPPPARPPRPHDGALPAPRRGGVPPPPPPARGARADPEAPPPAPARPSRPEPEPYTRPAATLPPPAPAWPASGGAPPALARPVAPAQPVSDGAQPTPARPPASAPSGGASPPSPGAPPSFGGGAPPPPPGGPPTFSPPARGSAPATDAPVLSNDLLSSITQAGIDTLKKVDRSHLERPSVVMQEARGEEPKGPPPGSGPSMGGGGDLAGALAAALSARKSKVTASDDEEDQNDDW